MYRKKIKDRQTNRRRKVLAAVVVFLTSASATVSAQTPLQLVPPNGDTQRASNHGLPKPLPLPVEIQNLRKTTSQTHLGVEQAFSFPESSGTSGNPGLGRGPLRLTKSSALPATSAKHVSVASPSLAHDASSIVEEPSVVPASNTREIVDEDDSNSIRFSFSDQVSNSSEVAAQHGPVPFRLSLSDREPAVVQQAVDPIGRRDKSHVENNTNPDASAGDAPGSGGLEPPSRSGSLLRVAPRLPLVASAPIEFDSHQSSPLLENLHEDSEIDSPQSRSLELDTLAIEEIAIEEIAITGAPYGSPAEAKGNFVGATGMSLPYSDELTDDAVVETGETASLANVPEEGKRSIPVVTEVPEAALANSRIFQDRRARMGDDVEIPNVVVADLLQRKTPDADSHSDSILSTPQPKSPFERLEPVAPLKGVGSTAGVAASNEDAEDGTSERTIVPRLKMGSAVPRIEDQTPRVAVNVARPVTTGVKVKPNSTRRDLELAPGGAASSSTGTAVVAIEPLVPRNEVSIPRIEVPPVSSVDPAPTEPNAAQDLGSYMRRGPFAAVVSKPVLAEEQRAAPGGPNETLVPVVAELYRPAKHLVIDTTKSGREVADVQLTSETPSLECFEQDAKSTTLLRVADTISVSPKEPIRRVQLLDREISEAVLVNPYKLLLIGRKTGATKLALWYGQSDEPEVREIRVVDSQPTVVGASLETVARRLTETIAATHPGSRVMVVPDADGLSVQGQASDSKSAKAIMRMVRSACLKTVNDQLEVR